jgi:multiple sugar transport system permease protein
MGLYLGRHTYTLMIVPAAVTILLIILYPLVYTLWMAVHEYSMGVNAAPRYIGLANYLQAFSNQRFLEAIPRTFYFTLLGVVAPTALGTAAALAFAREFPGRGLLRTVF